MIRAYEILIMTIIVYIVTSADQTDLSWGPPQDEEEGGDVQDIRDSNTLGQSSGKTRPSGIMTI